MQNKHASNDIEIGPVGVKNPNNGQTKVPGVEGNKESGMNKVNGQKVGDSAKGKSDANNQSLSRLLVQNGSGNRDAPSGTGQGSGAGAGGETGGNGTGSNYSYSYHFINFRIRYNGDNFLNGDELNGTIVCRIMADCAGKISVIEYGSRGTTFEGSKIELRVIVNRFLSGCNAVHTGETCPESGLITIKIRNK